MENSTEQDLVENDVLKNVCQLKHFSIKFVKESSSNCYFLVEALELAIPMRFYKKTMESVKVALYNAMVVAEKHKTTLNLMSEDEVLLEELVEDKKTNYQLRMTTSIYNRSLAIWLRTFYNSPDTGGWVHTKRAIKFSPTQTEFDLFNNFVNTRYTPKPKTVYKKMKKD